MKYVVALSGGVDSSVALKITTDHHSNVCAFYMKNWNEENEQFCSAMEDCEYALQVSEKLNIPFNTIELIQQYQERVFAYFLREYKNGRTPNPDILCNKEIKFSAFIDAVKTQSNEEFCLVTGHYARIEKQGAFMVLKKSLDTSKDQTYFLHALNQEQLRLVDFPLGTFQKKDVRQIAKKNDFKTHNRKDSTGICFIGERKMRTFLAQYLPSQTGDIIDTNGVVLGVHPGICFFTIGQRKGLGIGGQKNHSESAWYVADKKVSSNQLLVVQGSKHPLLYQKNIQLENLHWISGAWPQEEKLMAKIRYRQVEQACRLLKINDTICNVVFDCPQWGVSLGQFVVFYSGDVCLGGGVIAKKF